MLAFVCIRLVGKLKGPDITFHTQSYSGAPQRFQATYLEAHPRYCSLLFIYDPYDHRWGQSMDGLGSYLLFGSPLFI